MYVYYLIMFFTACSAVSGRRGNFFYIFICIFLVMLCALQASGISEDHINYVNYVTGIADGSLGLLFIEPTFYIITKISLFAVGNGFIVFLIYGVLGVGLKFYVAKRVSHYYWYSVSVYVSYLYFLQDFTQIRVGVAVGFLLLSTLLYNERKFAASVFSFFCAVTFHYSVVIFLPFFIFFYFNTIRMAFCLYVVCCILLLLYSLNLSLLKGLLELVSDLDIDRLNFYIGSALSGEQNSVSFIRVVFHFILLTPLVFLFDKIKVQSSYVSYSVIIHLCGLVILLVLHDFQVFAYRISDIFNGFMIFSLISYIFIFGRVVGGVLILSVSFFQIIYVLAVLGFVKPYTSILGGL